MSTQCVRYISHAERYRVTLRQFDEKKGVATKMSPFHSFQIHHLTGCLKEIPSTRYFLGHGPFLLLLFFFFYHLLHYFLPFDMASVSFPSGWKSVRLTWRGRFSSFLGRVPKKVRECVSNPGRLGTGSVWIIDGHAGRPETC